MSEILSSSVSDEWMDCFSSSSSDSDSFNSTSDSPDSSFSESVLSTWLMGRDSPSLESAAASLSSSLDGLDGIGGAFSLGLIFF